MSDLNRTTSSSCFPTTQWTQLLGVIQKGDDQAAWGALAEFCERYRPAVRNFFLRRGSNPEQADERTQAFFTNRILERWDSRDSFLHLAEREGRGRFRSFLCHVLWRFHQDELKKERAIKAGGAATHVSLDDPDAATEISAPESFEQFGREFDRVFALEIIRRAAERSKHSRHLEAHLRGEITQQEAAAKLGLKENAFKQAYARFRERLGRQLLEEVTQLAGPDPKEIRAELRYLMSLFADGDA